MQQRGAAVILEGTEVGSRGRKWASQVRAGEAPGGFSCPWRRKFRQQLRLQIILLASEKQQVTKDVPSMVSSVS